MLFCNTNDKTERVTFQAALLKGQAPNYGLYTIDRELIPQISMQQISGMADEPYWRTAYEVLLPYLQNEIPAADLESILKDAYDEAVIPAPVQNVYGRINILWLTQGPTSSFKDFAARFFARVLNYFAGKLGIKLIVVVATSGDTGPAIASSLYGLDNVAVLVLYPSKNIYAGQRKQMTTLQGNVFAVEVLDGDFNLCQDLAIRLMNDKRFARDAFCNDNIFTSANSISLGRLLPQIVFPFYAYSKVARDREKMIISIPSGNFGDMMGSVIAMKMGLPIKKIIVAVNENDEFARYLKGEEYRISSTKNTYSSAMDVNNPNNLPRLFDIYGGRLVNYPDRKGTIDRIPSLLDMRRELSSVSICNGETLEAIKKVYLEYQTILDPHGAVGWAALEKYISFPEELPSVCWETADPCKFPEVIEKAIKVTPPLAENMAKQVDLPERRFIISARADQVKKEAAAHSQAQYDQLKQLAALRINL